MKILLTTLNSKYIHSNLALKYLYAVCEDFHECLYLQEFTINNDNDYIYGELIREGYDIICFSCYIWNIERTLSLVDDIKKAKPNIITILGGPEVSFQPFDLMKNNKGIDFILTGEGEESFPLLLEILSRENWERMNTIKGLIYRQDGEIEVNPKGDPADFNQVPFPYKSLVSEADKIIYYESTRGCPFSCSYCLSAADRGVRALPLDRVKQDLSYFIYKNVKQVKFVDRTFNYNKVRALEIFKYLINLDNGVTNFHFEICADLFDQEALDLLKNARPGLFQFEIGIQSTNKDTLKAINRSMDFSNLSANIESLIESGNIHLHLDLIAGLPYEDYDSFKKSFNDVYALGADYLQLGFLKLLKGTPIADQIEEHGYVFRTSPPYEVISNKYISSEDLINLKMLERVFNLYYNRGGFQKSLEYCAYELCKSPFDFYEEFAHFYYLKGYQHKSHKREDLYRIFYQYGQWKDRFISGAGIKLEELLKQDLMQALTIKEINRFKRKRWEL
ncbi:MAG: DUF4080 domain-containing protein [Clostridiales bacterium]|jgi:radical SAM superfamily enzyme YgiQ (UPF0313 family)|nr:DUF4080 domain-containing protein [Clostridiales bacterium]